MTATGLHRSSIISSLSGAVLLFSAGPCAAGAPDEAGRIALANRLTWGASPSTMADRSLGSDRWLAEQLRGDKDTLPDAAQAQIAQMRISKEPLAVLVAEEDARDHAANALTDPDQKRDAQKAYQLSLNALTNEAATRSLLRDLYSPAQLREQLTWFWSNHFNVQANKRNIRAMVGDYEEHAIRAHALGRFRDLLEATLCHPAMLRYLDNDQNAAGHINENYAREIMELHSMGVGSGYSQKDVQELARILTGVGVNSSPNKPTLKPDLQPLYRRTGLFEFNPARHDFGDKQFLGQTIKGSGFAEVEQALDLIATSPATAHHISTRLATYFMGDNPPPIVVDRMVKAWKSSNGDIATVLRAMIRSPEFSGSMGSAFKDPLHYVVSAVRMAYDDRVILNSKPIFDWLYNMGEIPFAHETPDGYSLASASWTGPGQMTLRFEIARRIGTGSAGLFEVPAPGTAHEPAFPQLQNALYFNGLADTLAPRTRAALSQASSPQDWNALFLSSPEFMRR